MIYQENRNVGNESTLNTYEILNNLSLYDGRQGKAVNFKGIIKEVAFTGSDSDIMVIHNLGKKPTGFMIIKPLYNANYWGVNESQWTTNKMWLRTNYVIALPTTEIKQLFWIW